MIISGALRLNATWEIWIDRETIPPADRLQWTRIDESIGGVDWVTTFLPSKVREHNH